MANLEPLKNLNELLTQVIDFAENDPSVGKILEMASHVAKQWTSSTRPRVVTPIEPEESEEEEPSSPIRAIHPMEKTQAVNSPFNSLGNMLDMANHLGKQMAKFGPLFTALMKSQNPPEPPRRSHHHGKSRWTRSENRDVDEKMVTNALLGALVPVLLLSLAARPHYGL